MITIRSIGCRQSDDVSVEKAGQTGWVNESTTKIMGGGALGHMVGRLLNLQVMTYILLLTYTNSKQILRLSFQVGRACKRPT